MVISLHLIPFIFLSLCYFCNFSCYSCYLLFAGGAASVSDSNSGQTKGFDPTGWELALVTTPSTDISSATERQLVGHSCALLLWSMFLVIWKLHLETSLWMKSCVVDIGTSVLGTRLSLAKILYCMWVLVLANKSPTVKNGGIGLVLNLLLVGEIIAGKKLKMQLRALSGSSNVCRLNYFLSLTLWYFMKSPRISYWSVDSSRVYTCISYEAFLFSNECQAGGLDSLTLNSLYEEGAYRASQQPAYGAPAPNPFEVHDPFAMSNGVAAPHSVQMATMAQQPVNPFGPYQPTYQQQLPQQQQQQLMMSPANPFGDTTGFGTFPVNPAGHSQTNNPFGTPGLL